jgi:SAM-dependent methyltransferase
MSTLRNEIVLVYMMQGVHNLLVDYSNQRSMLTKFKDYQDYITAQTVEGLSHETDSETWTNGQIRCINEKFKDVPRHYKILIASCGDGVCLKQLKTLGFTDVTGLEIADEKIAIAQKINPNIIKTDICSGPFNLTDKYDIIYSSHTLEHVLYPEYTMKELTKFIKPDGTIHMILPYPDSGAADPKNVHRFRVHCGVIPLGLHVEDKGKTTCEIFTNMGFDIINHSFYSYREDEIHLVMKKRL